MTAHGAPRSKKALREDAPGTKRDANRDKTFAVHYLFAPMKFAEEEAWREQCRHQLERDVAVRIKYGFCHVHKPVLDDAPFRAFATMAEYRDWCEQNLPAYLGYHRPAQR